MTPPATSERYKNHRCPGEVIRHGVWLYYRFPFSYRDVQARRLERCISDSRREIKSSKLRALQMAFS
jgi:putative transposase